MGTERDYLTTLKMTVMGCLLESEERQAILNAEYEKAFGNQQVNTIKIKIPNPNHE